MKSRRKVADPILNLQMAVIREISLSKRNRRCPNLWGRALGATFTRGSKEHWSPKMLPKAKDSASQKSFKKYKMPIQNT